MIGLIVAYAHNKVIGNKGRIPWRIKGEQRRFKELTTGNVVVMGRRSFDEIGHPLPNRFTIVVSKTAKYEFENCTTLPSVKEALEYAEKNRPGENVYLSGGAGIYKEGLPFAEKLFITEVELEVEGEIPYSYVTYTKKTADKGGFRELNEN